MDGSCSAAWQHVVSSAGGGLWTCLDQTLLEFGIRLQVRHFLALAVTVALWLVHRVREHRCRGEPDGCPSDGQHQRAAAARQGPTPPGPWGWPVVGHIFSLGPNPHLHLTQLSERHGDVMSLRLGSWSAVVISGHEAVRDALVKQGDLFADRPRFPSFALYAGGTSISFQPYGRTLQLHRRLTSRALGSEMQERCQGVDGPMQREARALISTWMARSDEKQGSTTGGFDPNTDITLAVAGILYSLCFGPNERLLDNRGYVKVLTKENPATELFGLGNHVDIMPWLRCFSQRGKHLENVHRMQTLLDLNNAQRGRLAERGDSIATRDLGGVMSAMLETARSQRQGQAIGDVTHDALTEDHLMNTSIEFLSAGTETSSATLLWLLLYMAAYPATQTQVYEETSRVLGPGNLPSACDRTYLPFTQACTLEVMRLTTVVPFGLPHCTTRDANFRGYFIPKGTLTYINLWSTNRDKRTWENPNEFRPERFLRYHSDGKTTVDESKARLLQAFGAGRRKCIGEGMGKLQVFVLFVSILQHFQIEALPEMGPVDFTAKFGDVLKPQFFFVTARRR